MTEPEDRSNPPEFPPLRGPWGYFLRLAIENVRCFGPEQTLDLCHPKSSKEPARWTVILGENGTGKTTLLQALVAMELIPSPRKAAEREIRLFIRPESLPGWGFKDVSRSSLLPMLASDILRREQEGKRRQDQFHVHFHGHGGGAGGVPDLLNFPLIECFAYGSSRKINEIRTSTEYVAEEGYETLFSETVGLTDPAELFSQAYLVKSLGEEESDERERAGSRLEKLKAALIEALPDVRDINIEVRDNRPVVLFDTAYGRVRSSQLSSGYRAMAARVGDLVGRMFDAYPDSDDPLAEPAVVLVDEFDLHMHPRWQREAITFLTQRFPATQFVVTAHSPLVVQSAPNVNIALLRREGDHVVIDNDPVSVANWRIDQILTSELFGLESARSPEVQKILDERKELLQKPSLDAQDKERLRELEELTAAIPFADSPAIVRGEGMIGEIKEEFRALIAQKSGANA